VNQGSLFDGPARVAGPSRLIVFCDGGSRGNPGPAAIGAVVVDPATEPPTVLAEIGERIGKATNNVAEYRAMIAGLAAAAEIGAKQVIVRADSLLVVQQMRGIFKVKHPDMKRLYLEAREQVRRFDRVEFVHVPREENTAADALVNRALDGE
jgi:ribonuclease HI